MKTFLLCFLSAIAAAQNCSQFNVSSPVSWSIAGDEHHVTGAHTFVSTLTGKCSYSGSTPGAACATTCVANATLVSKTDTGIRENPIDGSQELHYLGQNAQNGSATNPSGSSSIKCGVTGAVTANNINSTAITFVNVSPDGLSATAVYPAGYIFGRSSGNVVTCDPRTLPVTPPPTGCCKVGASCGTGYQCNQGCSTSASDPKLQCIGTQCTCVRTTPIIIDTTGGGFHLTSAENGVTFDFFANGHPFKIAWTEADSGNGFLVFDENGDGNINGSELFGNVPDFDSNGFLKLAKYDSNADGRFDSRDALYSDPRFGVWIDDNHDGVMQPGEFHRPQDVKFYGISLAYKEEQKQDKYHNTFRYRAAVNPDVRGDSSDGRWGYDVLLDSVHETKCSANKNMSELLR